MNKVADARGVSELRHFGAVLKKEVVIRLSGVPKQPVAVLWLSDDKSQSAERLVTASWNRRAGLAMLMLEKSISGRKRLGCVLKPQNGPKPKFSQQKKVCLQVTHLRASAGVRGFPQLHLRCHFSCSRGRRSHYLPVSAAHAVPPFPLLFGFICPASP